MSDGWTLPDGCGHFDAYGDPDHDCTNWEGYDDLPEEGSIAHTTGLIFNRESYFRQW